MEQNTMQKYFKDYGHNGRSTVPLIKIDAFKKSGKYYDTKISEIKGEILNSINNHLGFEVLDLIRRDHESVRHLSPFLSGFSNLCTYFYVIEVFNTDGFMNAIITDKADCPPKNQIQISWQEQEKKIEISESDFDKLWDDTWQETQNAFEFSKKLRLKLFGAEK